MRTGSAWMVTAGVAAVLNARVTLDLAPTKARLKGYGFRLSLCHAF